MTNFPRQPGIMQQVADLARRIYTLERQSVVQRGNDVVMTDGAGIGFIPFPRPYPAGSVPVVTMTGGNLESLTMGTGAATTPTGFGFKAYTQTGALLTSFPVRVFWIATAEPS